MIIKIEGEEYDLPNDITKQELAELLGSPIKEQESPVAPQPTGEPININVTLPSGKKHVKVNRAGGAIDSLDVTEEISE